MSDLSLTAPRRGPRWSHRLGVAAQAAAALLATLLFIAPILWMISTALKTGNQAFSATPQIFVTPTFENFEHVFTGSSFGAALLTSAFTATVSTLAALILGAGIAYPLARRPGATQQQVAFWVLSLRILPPIVVIIPLFLLFRSIGLTGSLWSLIILYTYMNLPLTVWLLRGFSTALLAFIFAWNEFLFANVLTGASTRTAPVSLTEYVNPVSVEWNNIMAAGTLVVLPVWIFALAVQRYLVRGMTMGAVK
jgi:ABC-type glycerol-3-phosphate transport system permease component